MKALSLGLAVVAISGLLMGSAEVRAADSPEKQLCKATGEAVLYFCRPSAALKYDGMSHYSIKRDEDVVIIRSKHRWRGGFTNTDYTTEIHIEVRNTKDGLRVSSIEYDDNCLTPNLNANKLRDFRQTVNKVIQSDPIGAKWLGALADSKN